MAKRPDGKIVKNVDPFMKIIPYIMLHRNDAMNYNFEDIDCAGMDEFMRTPEAKEHNVGYMHIIMAAIVRTVYERPELNRFIMNGRIYERDKVWMSMSVHRSLRGDLAETTLKIPFTGNEPFFEIADTINRVIDENTKADETNGTDDMAKLIMGMPGFLIKPVVRFLCWMDRHNIMPRSIIDVSPFHTTFFITNLKSLGIGTILHHIYNFGTTSMFVSMGKERYQAAVADRTEIKIKKQIQLGITTDERICDGLYFARSTRLMRRYMEHPEQLLEVPAPRE